MGDIQCPARIFVGSPVDEAQVPDWRTTLRREGVVAEYDLRGRRVGVPDLVDLSDVHRGEAVLVLVDVGVPLLGGAGRGEVVAFGVDSNGLFRLGIP